MHGRFRCFGDTGSLGAARSRHTATLLPNGKVLVAGGYYIQPGQVALASAELYDPASGTWSITGESLATARYEHTATMLPNGKVVVAGGSNAHPQVHTLRERGTYDPASGTWTATVGLIAARKNHTATLLLSGKVLVAGGIWLVLTCDRGTVRSCAWNMAATGDLGTARTLHTATLLPNGNVLVAGGLVTSALASAELYDPASGTWNAADSLGIGA